MSKFITRSTSYNSAEVEQDILIDETSTTRRVFRAVINDVKISTGETVSGTIIHQRKGTNHCWEDYEPIDLNTLKSGEGVRLRFRSTQLKRFFEILRELYCLGNQGVTIGEGKFVVGDAERFVEVPENRKPFIQKLLEQNYGEEVWNELVATNPNLGTRLAHARLQYERSEALAEFKKSLADEELDESYWQKFFQNNQWIFGYGLNYQFNTVLSDQPHYGGIDYTGSGAQRGDFLLTSNAIAKFTRIVEIKKPGTKLLTYQNGKPKSYRNGACLIGSELAGAVSQMQVNCKTWQKSSLDFQNYKRLRGSNIHTVQPGGILVIGNTNELSTDASIETFEIYRRNLINPEIITFDELFERAKFIVANDGVNSSDKNELQEYDDISI